jgi:opacity protein-like surface antigen
MRPITVAALCALALALSTTTSLSADLAPAEPSTTVAEPPYLEDLEAGTNWYLRGDIGYDTANADFTRTWSTQTDITGEQTGESWSFGAGVGYNFGLVRTDVTIDMIGEMDATGARAESTCDGFTGSCSTTESTAISAIPILANAYIDLGTWGGFTPYIGAGLGAAMVTYDDWTTRETCVTTAGQTCPAIHANTAPSTTVRSFTNEGSSNWYFAYALMAGTSYALSDVFALDLGYRYLGIADGAAVAGYKYNNAGSDLGVIKAKGRNLQDVRLGLRYYFN